MKILIWIGCALVYGIVITLLNLAGLELGGLPVVVFCALIFWLARTLCRIWDRKPHNRTMSAKMILDALKKYNAPWPIVIILIVALLCGVYQNHALRNDVQDLEEQLADLQEQADVSIDIGNAQEKIDNLIDGFEAQYAQGKEDGYVDGYIDGYLRAYDEAAERSDDIAPLDSYSERYLKISELREELDGDG